MPLSAAEIEDNTIKLTPFIFFYLLLTTSIYEASGACETLVKYIKSLLQIGNRLSTPPYPFNGYFSAHP